MIAGNPWAFSRANFPRPDGGAGGPVAQPIVGFAGSRVAEVPGEADNARCHRHPGEADKVYRLADFSGRQDRGDVADPFGGSLEQYRRAYFELEEHILAAVPRLRDYLRGRDAKETRN